ncbi:MAG: 50S ribosomal protein L10 [Actinomycetota bacterium]|nr:50S ribosomal protein L10 [Actinomycetota bacterium]
MGEPRPEKVAVVEEVRERLSSSNGALLTEYRGLKVSDLAALRRSVVEAGGDYKIYKNTLVRRAVAELELTDLDPLLVGPTAIAFVDGDAVAVAKSLRDFARGNPNLTIKGGLLGTKVLSAADAAALADVAPREVILAQLAGAFAAPLVKMAGLLQALPRNFAYGLSALLEKRQKEAPAEPETAAVEAATAPAESGAAPVQPETVPAPSAAEPDTASSEPDTASSEPDAASAGAATASVEPENAPVEPEKEGDQ